MYLDRCGLDMRLCNVTDMIQRYYGATHVPLLQLLSRPVWITEVILEVLLLLRLQVEFLKLLCQHGDFEGGEGDLPVVRD